MLAKTPDVILKNAWLRIPKNIKVTFISSFIIGLITHMYMITNTLPNHDEFKNMAESLAWASRGSGRWLLETAGLIGGIFTLPWVNGLILIIYLAISSSLVVSMAKVKKHLYCVLISGIMVTVPMVTAFMTYMGVVPGNIGSILLATLAAFIATRYKFGFIFATIPIVLSLALYQSAFSITAALLVLVLIMEVIDNRTPWKKTLLNGIKYLGTLIGGLLLYFLSIRILYPYGIPNEYQGLGQMGQINLEELPWQIRMAYLVIARFFLEDYWNYHYPFMNVLFALSFVACTVLVIILCIRKNLFKEPVKVALLAILIIMFPFACNLIYIMGAHWIHDLMIYASVFILVFLIIIVDRYAREPKEESHTAKRKEKFGGIIASLSTWVITITMVISMFNYGILANQVYFRLNIGYQVTYAQSILLISRIQSLEGYTTDMDIVMVGSPYIPQGIPELHNITMIGANGPELMLDSWAYPYFLQRHLNFPNNVEVFPYWVVFVGMLHGDEDIINLVNLVVDMPIYPAEGSIAIIDGTIFVRHYYIHERPPYRVG